MRSQDYGNPAYNSFSGKESTSLKVSDIPGAMPKYDYSTKKIDHYDGGIGASYGVSQTQNYGLSSYGDSSPSKTQKKHYGSYNESEINRYNVMKGFEVGGPAVQKYQYDRSLNNQDIAGTLPGSLQSKPVKNLELAAKMRESYGAGGYEQYQPQPQPRDALDRFQQEQTYKQTPDNISYGYQAPPQQYSNVGNYGTSAPQNIQSLPQQSYGGNYSTAAPQNIPQQSGQYQYSNQQTYNPTTGPRLNDSVSANDQYQYVGQPQGFAGAKDFSATLGSPRDSYNDKEFDRNRYIEDIHQHIVVKQPPLDRPIQETMKSRAYNIISNQPRSPGPSVYTGMPYGYAIKALNANEEHTKIQDIMHKRSPGASPERQPQPPSPQKLGNDPKVQGTTAGRNNTYAETDFRYAYKLPPQDPLPDNQYYGSKALKNLSGVKLY